MAAATEPGADPLASPPSAAAVRFGASTRGSGSDCACCADRTVLAV